MIKSSLFCLLLLLTAADDALATLTPGTEDDVAAAENNEYLPQPRSAQAGRLQLEQTGPPPGRLQDRADPFLTAPSPLRRAEAGLPPGPGPDPLYVLMSLQR
jgi:hypothetical protein